MSNLNRSVKSCTIRREKMTKEIKIGEVKIGGNNPLVLIAGPCVIESEEGCLAIARTLKEMAEELDIPLIFKASYDKANRTSISSFRGPCMIKGLKILKRIKEEIKVPVLCDVHEVEQVKPAAKVIDVIQIPAFLCRQTDLIVAAGRSKRVINIKKGQFLAPWDIANVIEKVTSTGNENVFLTERGSCFGYNNLVVDMRSLPLMAEFGYPVVFDVTHSLQLPGGAGKASGGQRQFIPHLARASAAVGIDGLFMEVHPWPDRALCDGSNMLKLQDLPELLRDVKEIDRIVKERKNRSK